MKTPRHIVSALFIPLNAMRHCCWVALLAVTAGAGEFRVWTDSATGRTFEGSLENKSADNSEASVKRKDNGTLVPVKTGRLSEADKSYIKNWKPAANPVPAGGIALGRVSTLSQAQGGKSAVMEDLEFILSKYGKPEKDLAAHPDVTVYEGPAPGGDGNCRITYLMPRGKAEALLFKNRGIISKKPAVAPSFPPGMIIHTYDIRFLIYNRLHIMVDQADQVVTLQFKAEHAYAPADPLNGWVYMERDFSTFDYMNTETRAVPFKTWTHVKPWKDYIVINMAAESRNKETTTWYVPQPLIKQILFNIQEDKRRN